MKYLVVARGQEKWGNGTQYVMSTVQFYKIEKFLEVDRDNISTAM